MGRISQKQLVVMIALLTASTSPFYFCIFIALSGYAVWVATLAAGMIGLLLAYAALALARSRPEAYFMHFGARIIGKWPHFVFAAIICYYSIYLGSYVLRQMQEFILQTYLPGTPVWAVGGAFVLCAALGARLGIESIARFSQLVFLISALLIVILLPLLAGSFEMHKAAAFIRHVAWKPVWNGAIVNAKIFGESFLLLLLYPLLADRGKTGKSLLIGVGLSVFMIIVQLIPILLIFSAKLAADMPYPFLDTVRFIRVAGFLENLDPLIVTFWILGFYVKISLCLFCAVFGVSQLLSLKDYRPLCYTGGLIMYGFSQQMAESAAELSYTYEYGNASLGLIVECIPVIYLAVDWIRKMAGKRTTRPESPSAGAG